MHVRFDVTTTVAMDLPCSDTISRPHKAFLQTCSFPDSGGAAGMRMGTGSGVSASIATVSSASNAGRGLYGSAGGALYGSVGRMGARFI